MPTSEFFIKRGGHHVRLKVHHKHHHLYNAAAFIGLLPGIGKQNLLIPTQYDINNGFIGQKIS